jgi:hypothetical protein
LLIIAVVSFLLGGVNGVFLFSQASQDGSARGVVWTLSHAPKTHAFLASAIGQVSPAGRGIGML